MGICGGVWDAVLQCVFRYCRSIDVRLRVLALETVVRKFSELTMCNVLVYWCPFAFVDAGNYVSGNSKVLDVLTDMGRHQVEVGTSDAVHVRSLQAHVTRCLPSSFSLLDSQNDTRQVGSTR